MVRLRVSLGVVLLGASLLPEAAAGAPQLAAPVEARVWLDRGEEPTLRRGESARLYYRASRSAYVAIFQIDTNGTVRMVFPRSPDENHFIRGGIDYRLLFARSSFWQVDDDPGVGYFFLIASPEPFDFTSFRYSRFDRGWDVSQVAREVFRDPYVAMDEYVAALIPEWRDVAYGLDFVTYHVDRRHDYPRFLCYDCHGFRPYAAWNPYLFGCSEFRVVVYDDPYYYPATRYRGDRVVFVRPPEPFEPRFAFKERNAGEPTTPLVLSAARRTTAGVGSGGSPGGGRSPAGGSEGGEARRGGAGAFSGASGTPPVAPGARGTPPGPTTGRMAVPSDGRGRPVLQPRPAPANVPTRPESRPEAPSSGGTTRPEVRPQPATPSGRGSQPTSGGAPPPPVSSAPRRPPGG